MYIGFICVDFWVSLATKGGGTSRLILLYNLTSLPSSDQNCNSVVMIFRCFRYKNHILHLANFPSPTAVAHDAKCVRFFNYLFGVTGTTAL